MPKLMTKNVIKYLKRNIIEYIIRISHTLTAVQYRHKHTHSVQSMTPHRRAMY